MKIKKIKTPSCEGKTVSYTHLIKGGNEMFCFDVQKGLWHKEDDTRMLCTATYNDTMYYVNDENNYICLLYTSRCV